MGRRPNPADFLRGSGFGGSSKGGGDAKATLRSNATAKIVALLGEGEIVGLTDGEKSIFFDDTPYLSEDGQYNFKGVNWAFRAGLPTQTPLPNFGGVETETSVTTQVKKDNPIVRSLTDSNFTSARVTITFPALYKTTNQGTKHTSVDFRIEVRYYNGPWTNPFGDLTIQGINTSSYDKDYLFTLPVAPNGAASYPWDIRVTRISNDHDDDGSSIHDDLYFGAITGIIDDQFIYPDSALMGLTIDAEQFGQGMPQLGFELDGRIVSVPSNYDPVARTYTGLWDGTFKESWSDNPAWMYYDMLENDRFGLGDLLESLYIDKWSLYAISQACDVMVPDGYGGTEPRFRMNVAITDQEEAYNVMQQIASAFRGMSYWASGAITATQDIPEDAALLVTKASVINGEFKYQSSALTARHTICQVTWLDPNDRYEPAVEVVTDTQGLIRYGPRIKEITAFGCTSRGQARRLGLWTLLTELNQTQTLTYSAGLDHASLRPGAIVSVMDPEIAGVDYGGRILTSSTNAIGVDRPITLDAAKTYTLYVILPDGSVASSPVNVTAGTTQTIGLANALASPPLVGALWVLASSDVSPKPYRIVSIAEKQPHIYDVTALEEYVEKQDILDGAHNFDPPSYRVERPIDSPTDLTAAENQYFIDGVPHADLTFSWKTPATLYASAFYVEIYSPDNDDRTVLPAYTGNSYTLTDVQPGTYTLNVYSLGLRNAKSAAATLTYEAKGWTAQDVPSITNLQLVAPFNGPDCAIQWTNVFPTAPAGATNLLYRTNTVRVYDNAQNPRALLRTEQVSTPAYTYSLDKNFTDGGNKATRELYFEVTVTDTYSRTSNPATLTASNPKIAEPSISVQPGIRQILIDFDTPTDEDYAGTFVWVSDVEGFDPAATAPVYDGKGGFYLFQTNTVRPYYIRVAHYDTFSRTDFNASSEVSVTPYDVTIDTTPPAIPTGLALSSVIDPSDANKTVLTATWNANTEDDLAGYIVALAEDGGNFVEYPVGESTTYPWALPPNTAVSVKVLAFDKAGNKSAFCAEVAATTVKDTTPPAVPTNPAALGGAGVIWLTWVNPPDKDFSHVEVWESSSNDSSTAARIAEEAGISFARTNLDYEVTRYYWLKAVDTSGNVSAFTASVTASTTPKEAITTEELAGLIDQTSFAQSVAVPGRGDTLPAITSATPKQWYLTTDKSIYVQKADGSGWIEQTDVSLLIGQLQAGQIGANAIGAREVAADVISASKLVLTDKTNLIPDDQMLDPDAWSSDAGTPEDGGWTNNGPSGLGSKGQWYWTVTAMPAYSNGLFSKAFPIDDSKQYYFSINAYAATSGQATILCRISWRDYAGSEIFLSAIGQPTIQAGVLTPISAALIPPSGATSAIVQIYVYAPTTTCSQVYVAQPVGRVMASAELIVDGAIRSNHLDTNSAVITGTAQIADAIVTNEKVVSLDAIKITAQSIESNNALIGLINGANVKIAPGQILISGSTSLSNWIYGGDNTSINGGAIAANTVDINKLTVGLRGITVAGIQFTANTPSGNCVSWTAGTITYVNDDGTVTTENIAAGSGGVSTNAAIVFIRGRGVLYFLPADTHPAYQVTGGAEQCVVLAKYSGGTKLVVNVGQTIIDGGNIKGIMAAFQQADIDSMRVNILTAGSISAEMAQFGRASNWIENSDFSAGLARWVAGGNSPGNVFRLRNDNIYNVYGHPCAEVYSPNASEDGTAYYDICPADTNGATYNYPCVVGQRYELSAYINTHRCPSQLYVEFKDGSGNHLSYGGPYAAYPATNSGGGSMAMFTRRTVFFTAPAGAVTMVPYIRKLGTDAGQADSYMFLYRVQLAEASANQTEPSPWSPSGVTQIAGDVIKTGSVTADKADIASFKTNILTAASVNAQMMAIGTSSNMVSNSDFLSKSLRNVAAGYDQTSGVPALGVDDAPYYPQGMNAAYITLGSTPAPGAFADIFRLDINGSGYFPVVAGARYECSAYMSIHRCTGMVRVLFLDANNNVVGDVFGNACGPNVVANTSLNAWSRSGVFVTAPANATKCWFRIYMSGVTGEPNPYIFFTGLYLGQANPNQTILSPWVPMNGSVLDGTGLITKSVKAEHIDVDSLDALSANLGNVIVDGNLVVNGSLSGAKRCPLLIRRAA